MDIIIILGCSRGLEKKEDKNIVITNKSHLYYRLEEGFKVYNEIDNPAKIIICSGGGSVNEAVIMKEYLTEKGIPDYRIHKEIYSKNTIENCIFTYQLLSRYLAKELSLEEIQGKDVSNQRQLELDGINKLTWIDISKINIHLVTSDYHIERSLLIFNHFKSRLNYINSYINSKIIPHSAFLDNNIVDTDIAKKSISTDKHITKNLNTYLRRYDNWYPSMKDYEYRTKL